MATSFDLLIKQRSVIEFLAAEGCSAANIHARMKSVYGEMCISDCAVRKWKYLKGHQYDNDEEVIVDVRRWCRGQSSEFFADGVRQLVKRWRLSVDRDDRADKSVLRDVTGVTLAALGEIRRNFRGRHVTVGVTSASPRTRDRLARMKGGPLTMRINNGC
ncbi:transposase [Plakobranchus ocellatus]|uniref:Transposase n=1 Tax=Plakobranchus ocellatus TaxID=259542 RepID=A0AAV4BPH0_9GAST|nr:transposase [Plakobranchus ocellatus]